MGRRLDFQTRRERIVSETAPPETDFSVVPSPVYSRLLETALAAPLGEMIDNERAGLWLGDRLFPPYGPRCPDCDSPPPNSARFWSGKSHPCTCGRRWPPWRVGTPFESSPLTPGDVVGLLLGLRLERPPREIAAWCGSTDRTARTWRTLFGLAPRR